MNMVHPGSAPSETIHPSSWTGSSTSRQGPKLTLATSQWQMDLTILAGEKNKIKAGLHINAMAWSADLAIQNVGKFQKLILGSVQFELRVAVPFLTPKA